jgi:hypothetical protein
LSIFGEDWYSLSEEETGDFFAVWR